MVDRKFESADIFKSVFSEKTLRYLHSNSKRLKRVIFAASISQDNMSGI